MCNCSTDDGPSCFRARRRKARKEHRCVECYKTIAVGETYEYTSGVWDGVGDSFKTCLRCVVLREAHVDAEEAMQREEIDERIARERARHGATLDLMQLAEKHTEDSPWMPRPNRYYIEPCTPVIGQIIETIGECIRDDRRYAKHFQTARRALLAKQAA